MKFYYSLWMLVSCVVTLAAAQTPLHVVPAVREWEPGQGVLTVSGITLAVDPALDATSLQGLLSVIQEDLKPLRLDTNGAKGAVVAMKFQPLADKTNPEAYEVEIGEAIVIRGASPAAWFWGSRTVLQLLQKSCELPRGLVKDHPDYRGRMLMLDVGRKAYPLSALKDFIRMMAWYKMNELHLHLSDEAFGGSYAAFRVESKTFPGLAAKDLFYTHTEIRELQDFAKARGVIITPEIDMPGHARCFTNYWPEITLKDYPNYMDVTHPKTIEVMKKLLDEMIPLFDAPDFHIGTDEYRVGGPRRDELHESFRVFINTMNAHVRSRGKNCRIWSGFEHMKGTTQIDPTVIIDMWETDDAKGQIAKGHSIINSNHGRTYIVPGCHYYGISRGGIYEGWEPWMVSGDASKNPGKNDPKLLGGKLHVWFDQGPTGWTLTEVADTTLAGMQAFAEKLWGTKGSKDYQSFTARCAATLPVPQVTLLQRIPARKDHLVMEMPGEVTLNKESSNLPTPLAKADRVDLEYPWTLTMEVKRTAEFQGRGVLLSSSLAEICANYRRDEEQSVKQADGTTKKIKVERRGLGTLRAAGTREGDGSAGATRMSADTGKSSNVPLPLNEWATVTIVGEQNRNTIWLNGEKMAESNNQMVCPLAFVGGEKGQSFVGSIRKMQVWDRAFTAKEIGRAAGLDIPDNLAEGAAVIATVSDTAYGLIASNLCDGNPSTRWSSGVTRAEQSVTIDLKKSLSFNTVALLWEQATAGRYLISVSDDQKTWKEVFTGKGTVGRTQATFDTIKGRYVRIQCSEATSQWGYSIYEIEVMRKRQPKS